MVDKKKRILLDNLIKEKFPIIYDYNFDGIVLLFGGAIRNTIMGSVVKDLDFVIISQNSKEIIQFIKKYNLSYTKTSFGCYKIYYKNETIDMFIVDDIMDSGFYNIDMLFYDFKSHEFINFGAIDAIESRNIIELKNKKPAIYINKFRLKKIINFIKNVTKNNKGVKVRENRLIWYFRILKKRMKMSIKKFYDSVFAKLGYSEHKPKVLFGKSFEMVHHAKAALVTSGTATLETAILRTPQVVCYRMGGSRLIYELYSRVLKVKYVSLPNLIADAPVVKELLLHHCNAENIAAELTLLLDQEGEYYKKQQAGYDEIARRLTNAPSAATAACRLIDKLKKK